MRTISNFIRNNIFIISLISLYFLIGITLTLTWYRYPINPDGVAYMSIAEKYSIGNWRDAINGYWSPFLSWLMVPFKLLGLNLQTASRVINLLSMAALLVCVNEIVRLLKIDKFISKLLLITLLPLALFWSLAGPITPDVIAALIVVLYLYQLLFYRPNIKNQILLGATISVGYLTKSYLLYFFIAHITFVIFFSNNFRINLGLIKNIKPFFIVGCVTAVISLAWMAALASKYERILISTSGSYNLSVLNPGSPGQPVGYAGLLEMPNQSALTAWEDPSLIEVKKWSPFESKSSIFSYARIVTDNIKRTGSSIQEFSIIGASLTLVLFLLSFTKKDSQNTYLFLIMSASVIYIFGYCLLVVEARYLYPVIILILVGTTAYISGSTKKSSLLIKTGEILVVLTFILSPTLQLFYQRKEFDRTKYVASVLIPYVQPGDRLASNSFDTVNLCYYLRAKCFGALKMNDQYKNNSDLERNSINKILIRKDISLPKVNLSGYKRTAINDNLEIYIR